MVNNDTPKPPLTGSERVAAWKQRHDMKRKVVELPRDLVDRLDARLQADNTNFSSWVKVKVAEYLGEL